MSQDDNKAGLSSELVLWSGLNSVVNIGVTFRSVRFSPIEVKYVLVVPISWVFDSHHPLTDGGLPGLAPIRGLRLSIDQIVYFCNSIQLASDRRQRLPDHQTPS